jgi:hypothetical protein
MNDDKYNLVGKLISVYINCYGNMISDSYEILRLTLETYGILFRFSWIYDMKEDIMFQTLKLGVVIPLNKNCFACNAKTHARTAHRRPY